MRVTPLVWLGILVGTFSLGCAGVDDGSDMLQGSLRRGSRTPAEEPAPADEEHDAEDSVGETAADPGNPAADSKPAAPAETGKASAAFAVTLGTANPTMGLGEKLDLDVTVQPKAGFTGPVQIGVTGLSPGVTATPVTANVTGGAATVKLTLEAAYTAVVTPKAGQVAVVITAKAGSSEATANANLKVAPKMTLRIPMNVDALRQAAGGPLRAEWGEPFGPQGQPLRTQPGNGIVVSVFNADSKAHIIHGPGGAFPHGNTGAPIAANAFEMLNGQVRTRTLDVGQNVTGYPHDGTNGQRASFNIRVAAP